MSLRQPLLSDPTENEIKSEAPSNNGVIYSMPPLPTMALDFAESAQAGKVLGIGVCGINPSGCFDIAKGLSAQFSNVPYVRSQVITTSLLTGFGVLSIEGHEFLDDPAKYAAAETIFFTGCVTSERMLGLLGGLTEKYKFTSIKHVYNIVGPHHSFEATIQRYQNQLKMQKHHLSNYVSYQYGLLHSGVNTLFQANIGIPRFNSKTSTFSVPAECFGLIRHSILNHFLLSPNNTDSLLIENHLNEFFRQVVNAGKQYQGKPIMVLALGIEDPARELLLNMAKNHSITIDFCDHLPRYRLPQQEDFFKVLEAMKSKNGIASFDSTSTQCLLQALSFGAPVMVYTGDSGNHPNFYQHLVNLVSDEYKPTARVILGLSDKYDLFKDQSRCQEVYKLYQIEMNKAHQRFETFKSSSSRIAAQANLPVSSMTHLAIAPAGNTASDLPTVTSNSTASSCLIMDASNTQRLFSNSGNKPALSNANAKPSQKNKRTCCTIL